MARLYRDARVSRIYEGTNEINRVFLADRMVRRAHEGKSSLEGVADSFVSDLAAKAFAAFLETYGTEGFGKKVEQIHLGALSDLAMLAYAEQSARLRASQSGGINEVLYRHFLNWASTKAAVAYQTALGASVTLPEPAPADMSAIVDAVLSNRTPRVA